jgi:tetratricopeptide (TPR) repeat protein
MPRILIRLSLVIITLTFTAVPALAQQIQGQVRYAETNQPAIRVTVHCDGIGGNSIQMTDSNGKFFFRVSPGHYTVTVNLPGYRGEEQSADLTDTNSNEYFFFKLKPDATAKSGPAAVVDANVPEAARKEFEKADAALASNKKESTEEGIRHLEKAISIYPRFVQAQLKLGTAYMDLGQWDQAEKVLLNALATEPKTANALFALGEIYLSQKKDGEAEKVLLQGLQIEDRSFQAHLTLGRVYWDMALKTKDEAQARPLLDKSYEQAKRALELNPSLAGGHLLKGNLLLRVRRAPDALHEFEEYLRLNPKGQLADQTRAVVEKIKNALAQQRVPEQQKKP